MVETADAPHLTTRRRRMQRDVRRTGDREVVRSRGAEVHARHGRVVRLGREEMRARGVVGGLSFSYFRAVDRSWTARGHKAGTEQNTLLEVCACRVESC